MKSFGENLGLKVIRVDAEARFLGALRGESYTERKRKIIGGEFVKVFDDEAQKLTGVDLIAEPDRAKERDLAYQIAIQGMIDGWFTSRKLSQYFKSDGTAKYEEARAIINGTDQATRIADIGRRFSEILLEAST